jgi:hypothetical protein
MGSGKFRRAIANFAILHYPFLRLAPIQAPPVGGAWESINERMELNDEDHGSEGV